MDRALTIATRGHPSPNPHVGAVIVAAGEILAEAHHEQAGGLHAEVAALAQVGFNGSGATLYVTLEPCSHQGRTGPCWTRVLEAGIERVVIGCGDPVVAHAGGAALLAAHGVRTEIGVRREAAQQLIADFTKHSHQQLPYVLLWSAEPDPRPSAEPSAFAAGPSPAVLPLDAVLLDGPAMVEHKNTLQRDEFAAPQWILIDPDLGHVDRLPHRAGATARVVVYCRRQLIRTHGSSLDQRRVELRSIPATAQAQSIRPLLHALAQSGIVRLGALVSRGLQRLLRDRHLVDEVHHLALP